MHLVPLAGHGGVGSTVGDFPRHRAVTRIRDCMYRALNRRAPMCHAGVKHPGTRKWPRTVAAATKPTSARTCLRTTGVREQWSYRGDINTTNRRPPRIYLRIERGPRPRRNTGRGLSSSYRSDRNVSMRISEEIRRRSCRGHIAPEDIKTRKGSSVRCCAICAEEYSLTLQLMHVARAERLETLILRAEYERTEREAAVRNCRFYRRAISSVDIFRLLPYNCAECREYLGLLSASCPVTWNWFLSQISLYNKFVYIIMD